MAELQTYSTPGCLDFDIEGITNGGGKQIAGPSELAFIQLSSGSGPANATIHDAATVGSAVYNNQKMVLDCSTTDNDTIVFVNPQAYLKGFVVILRQGSGLGAALSYARVLP